jgi:hypothetical protein
MAKPKRKTIEVGTLLHRLNYFLASENSTAEEREVICTFVEGVLFDTGNYQGFRYLDTDEIEGNGSRRFYFVSEKIQADYDAAAALIEKHYYGRGV